MTGGTVCKFTVGSPGTSARYLRYISRDGVEREAGEGSLLLRLPEFLLGDGEEKQRRQDIIRWAHWEEQEEIRRYFGHGSPRTHYRAILSFETEIGVMSALMLAKTWLDTVLPDARACAYLHKNTAHHHIHIWIAARQTTGRKISLSARDFRQLDEHWNRLYAEAVGRDMEEHLHKKWQTACYVWLRRAGQAAERPQRAENEWKPALFTKRERARLEAKIDDRHESGTGTHQPENARESGSPAAGEQNLAAQEPAIAPPTEHMQQAADAAEHAISEAERIYQEASRLAERQPQLERELER